MIDAERLRIRVASDAEMRELIAAEPTEEMKAAYGEMLDGALAHPSQRQWYAVWFIYLKSGKKIGDLCFKGVSPEGSTEIGYGIAENYQGKGYATEAVGAAVKWALTQPGIGMVEAETDAGNLASQRVLEKIGFKATGQTGEEGPKFVFG